MGTKSTKNKTRKILVRIGFSLLVVLALLLIIIAIILNTIVTPKKITPVVVALAQEFVDGDVKCESVDITFFSTFPDLGVKLKNGSISSESDTLLAFENFMLTVNPVAFVMNKKIIVHQLELDDADIYAYVDTTGRANWDIFKTMEDENFSDTTAFSMPELNIKTIRLNNVNFTYDDLPQNIFVMVDSLNMRLKGNLSKEHADLSLGIRTAGITSFYQGQIYTQHLPFSFRTKLERDRVAKNLAIKKGKVKVGTLEFKTNGQLQQQADSMDIADVDIDFSLNASSLADLVDLIPAHILSISDKLVAGGKIESNGKLTGQLGKGKLPAITLSFQLINGTLASSKHPNKPFVEDFDIDLHTLLDISGSNPSFLSLKNLYLQTTSSNLSAKGELNHIFTQPSIEAEAKADVNFTQIADKLQLDGMKMGGKIDFNISARCLLDDILTMNLGKINANGTANIKDVRFSHTGQDFSFYTSNANMNFGSNTQDSIEGELQENLLRSKIVLDTLNLNWKKDLIANASRLSLLVTTSAPKDTSSIFPVMTGFRASNLRLVMGDSVRMRGVQILGGIEMKPRKDQPGLPEVSVGMSLDSLVGRAYDMGGRISNAKLKLKFAKQQTRQRTITNINRTANDSINVVGRGYSGRDTTLTRAQRDSLRRSRLDPTTNISFRIESQQTRDLFREWEISGGFSSKDIRIRTPYFPVSLRMSESDMTFTSNTLSLTKAHVRIGKSDFMLKGEVDGIRRALLYNGKVSAKMNLDADSLDVNELIRAAVAGSEYTQKGKTEKDSISGIILDEITQIIPDQDSTALGIFVIPRNLDIEFNSRIRNIRFNNISAKSLRGRIILRDQAIHLPRLKLNSDIGSATVTMVYKAPNTSGAQLGVEFGVKEIDVKELIGALPVINELAPMLSSFEGVVDCNITALTELDSLMNVRLPETTASCYLSGQNLVLLDGETFAEISKMLMFKNKNRNLIDSISVEMILEDEKLMIFPFQISMDRYNAAVGGIQNLDMSFDYHITVLKSPVPFKLGLNISGKPDKMKIRLGKAKYKDLFTVAREKKLDYTVINLRQEMDEKLRQSITEIVGADLSQPVRRPRVEIPDSLRHSFFHLEDTIAASPTDINVLSDTIPNSTVK